MSAELTQTVTGRRNRLTRADRIEKRGPALSMPSFLTLVLALLAIVFVLVGAANLDLGPADARVGLAAGAGFAPLGQVCGTWAPDLWPGRVV
ncbi:MAG: hypothetical protein ACP5XB_20765, partial [Isosphaeraceae bacterium]